MKTQTQIPSATSVFKTPKPVKATFEESISVWLNTEVYKLIINATPRLIDSRPPAITGAVHLDCPSFYYSNEVGFKSIVTETLTDLGYEVKFLEDFETGRAMCYISWKD